MQQRPMLRFVSVVLALVLAALIGGGVSRSATTFLQLPPAVADPGGTGGSNGG